MLHGQALCPRCGCSDFEEVSETEHRCAECGLGRTVARLTLRSDPDAPVDPRIAQRLAQADARMVDAFSRADFTPYALDSYWTGVRALGGWGGSEQSVDRLTILHTDDPAEVAEPAVRVETVRPRVVGGYPMDDHERMLLVQRLVQFIASTTGEVTEPVRLAAFADDGRTDPTGPWEAAVMPVNGRPTEARLLEAGAASVMLVDLPDLFVAVSARVADLTAPGLIAVQDLAPYIEGHRELRRRLARGAASPD